MPKLFQLLLAFSMILALLAGCSSVAPLPSSSIPSMSPTLSSESQLKEVIRASLLKTTPHYKNRGGSLEVGGETAFDGGFDWHSAVHGHWALLSLGRLTKDEELRSFVLNRLSGKALDKETEYLKSNPDFEMPYGRAWLIQLLVEMERQPEIQKDLPWLRSVRSARKESEDTLLSWLERTHFPDAGNMPRYYSGAQRIRGDHFSWLFGYTLLKLSSPRDSKVLRSLRKLEKRIEPLRGEIMASVHSDFDFLEPSALLALSDSFDDRNEGAYLCNRVEIPDKITRENAHRAGAYIQDSWPCAKAASRGNHSAQVAYQRHEESLLARPELWRDDFSNVGHWVPQFIWMGMWMRRGLK